ncbi:hypothetical protein P3T36_007659 [Kitasatospora sp. MAP12-15]|uniref:hypothetical protein n=1 Tax=unclassified Kitasatospora TaxID=2633591 RepID=UPI002475A2BF|nr:hypothetical protein [Kitasatospora sp. MAP12-44]MDH6115683.1 hypothetical protein [Kitasatospora sp. MAP12-44]
MTTPAGKHHVTAHHAWAWYREVAEPPLIPDRTPEIPDNQRPAALPSPPPPTPAPSEEQLVALIRDAATQARSHLLTGEALECVRTDDAIRIAALVPQPRLPEIAERLGLDIADLRTRLRTRETSDSTVPG